jgi:protein gp37
VTVATDTKIEWCDSTFNPWIGCTKVSTLACAHCYAEVSTPARSMHIEWGPGKPRHRTSASNWKQPLKWEANAREFQQQHGRKQRVFCASLADVFDNEVDPQWRFDLFDLIRHTPSLDWLLLTKRIGNVNAMISADPVDHDLPRNVWLGITVCNQPEADRDISKLLAVDASVRFLSIEPLMGPMDISNFLSAKQLHDIDGGPFIHWVIVGGESGHHARPMHPDWVRSLRDQCTAAGVAFFFKQWGEWHPGFVEEHFTHGGPEKHAHAWIDAETADHGLCWIHDDEGVFSNWTGQPRCHSDPDNGVLPCVTVMGRIGKRAAGRVLDGREWNDTPDASIGTISKDNSIKRKSNELGITK